MNEVALRTEQVQLIRLTGGRGTLVGPPARVSLALEHLRATGRLLNAADAVPHGDGRVVVNVRMRQDPPSAVMSAPAPQWWTRRRIAVVAVVAAVALVALAVVGAAVWLALSWIAAHAALVLITLVGAVLLLGVGGGCVTVVRVSHWH